MAVKEKMPKFGLSMEEGILGEWLVPIGAVVKRGERIAVIEAEKLTNDALATTDGVMLKYYLEPGDTAPCGEPICLIGSAGETDGDAPSAPAPAPVSAPRAADCTVDTITSATPRAQSIIDSRGLDAKTIPATGKHGEITIDDVREAVNAPVPAAPEGPVAITPRARMLAEKLHLSYSHIRGTGLLGMITVADVKAQGKPASESKIVPMNGVQRATAVAMKKSLDNTAQTTVCIESPFGALVAAYQHLKPFYAAEGIKLSYTAMIVYAVSRVLAHREDVRMQYLDEKNFVLPGGVHIGIAIDTEKGLIVPAVRNADQKPLRALCQALSDLSARAKSGKLTEADFGGAVTTITNLAMAGATSFTPILNPPETTILGVCKLRDMPVVKNGGVFVEPVMNLCLTYDHRVLNGAPACRYLQEVTDLLNETDWK
ncbi:MAG TPA: dihydrolipoamide acetyltransferase family protein [Feifaniaceae bacterium]|nr:dihydrolipoamide acetyltransferase family protein [Feifaniaceae bacterium]